MQVEKVAIASLVFDPANARKHDTKNLEAIKGSLARFGQQKVVVVDENNVIIAGNGTVQEAKELGWTEIYVNRTNLKGSDKTAFAIADNRTGELAAWDDGVLSKTLDALKLDGFDLSTIGFDDDDLMQWIKTPEVIPGCDEDEVPEVTDTRCKPGDLWQLGNHRLLCGDSTNVQHVERLMGGEKADMVFTDPPYGIDVVSASSTDGGGKPFGSVGAGNKVKANTYAPIIGDETTETAKEFWQTCQAIGLTNYVIWGGNYFTDFLPPKKCWVVWDKKGRAWDDNFSDFEMAWTSFDKPAKIFTHVWMGMVQSGEREERVHPTQKPSKLVVDCLDYVKAGSVYDGFLGSGSTLIACEKTNRRCFGCEIDPHYCDVILARWEKFTGQTAVLLPTK